ncbi:P-loop containing nucleoside triphosphate hydrolase protein [Phellopilus nigrolimitatus]|nr:P-loop containing nucleoside triphosphate hydrolase protein [Phellopilus nigrolimitatus]
MTIRKDKRRGNMLMRRKRAVRVIKKRVSRRKRKERKARQTRVKTLLSKRDKRKADADDLSLVEGESGKKEKKHKKSQDAGPSISAAQSSGSYVTPSDAEVSAYLSEHSITIDCGPSVRPNNPIQDNLKPALSFSAIFPRIPASLHEALSSFKEPTPIQACSWPAMLEGRDVVGIAETGSGKTLAFGIPAVSGIVKSRQAGPSNDPSYSKSEKKSKSKSKHNAKAHISVLALAPTRELALQTHETFTSLGAPFGLTSVALYGGVDKDPQRRALVAEGAAMVVGTPGRILDLLNEGACDLSGVTYLVLDEADRMLDKGFENDIRAIISHTGPSEGRQTLMFSATWPEAVRRLASSFLRDPIRVTVGSDDLTANRKVEQVVEVFDDQREKDSRLISHLRRLKARKGEKQIPDEARILIFVLYKKEAARVEQNLSRQGFSVIAIHGDLSQSARIAALDDFKSGRTQLLVATDVAARGLDIPNVGTVINYSFPLTVEDYIHRIGRTGRGGHSGKSITFFTGDNHERALAGELAKVLRESGFDADPLKKFPMTIKKKTHSVYGAFFRSDIPSDVVPTRIKF